MVKGWSKIVVVFAVILAVFLCKNLLANQVETSNPSKEEVVRKVQTLQVPFIVNNGQVDERVIFYARTFGGTVFVTKDGEIVYSLPNGKGAGREENRGRKGYERKIMSGLHGQALLIRAESEFAANVYLPLFCVDNANCPPERVLAKSLLATYLPGMGKGTGKQDLSLSPHSYPGVLPANFHPPSEIQNPQSPIRGVALKEHLIGGKINEIKGGTSSVTIVSYFKGNDPSKWKSNLSTYEVVDMGEVFKGIGLRLKAYGNNVEKLFTVTPNANPEAIKLGISGATSLNVNKEGQLLAETELGQVKFTKPVAYQEIDGKRVEVAVEYSIQVSEEQEVRGELEPQNADWETLNSKSTYSFTVASYDRTKDLIIDPLQASTFLGGSNDDYGISLAIDASNYVYVTGGTISTDFPTKSGAYDTSFNGATAYGGDVFVSKLNSGLTNLLASTFLGGTGWDEGTSLALDPSGNVYVTGFTGSSDFPTTSGAYDVSYNGSTLDAFYGDAFVSKLDSGLTSLLASTFLGGSGSESADSIALYTTNDPTIPPIVEVYLLGATVSIDFPTTSGAYNTSFNGSNGSADVFVSKLNSGLTRLRASTFLGGSAEDVGFSLALDSSGNVYVTGFTGFAESSDFPITNGAYDTSYNGGFLGDGFVSKLDHGLTSLLASTFLGGTDWDESLSLALDSSGNVYVTGFTESTDFPTTSGAYDTSFNGRDDVFVSKLDTGLTSLLASTFLGGTDRESGNSLTLYATLGGNLNVYVTGFTSSADFPTTSGAYDTSFNGGSSYAGDVFVSKLDSGLANLQQSTYLGGNANDHGLSIALNSSGRVFVTGYTVSLDFPTVGGAYDTSINGYDAFVSKLDNNLSQ